MDNASQTDANPENATPENTVDADRRETEDLLEALRQDGLVEQSRDSLEEQFRKLTRENGRLKETQTRADVPRVATASVRTLVRQLKQMYHSTMNANEITSRAVSASYRVELFQPARRDASGAWVVKRVSRP